MVQKEIKGTFPPFNPHGKRNVSGGNHLFEVRKLQRIREWLYQSQRNAEVLLRRTGKTFRLDAYGDIIIS